MDFTVADTYDAVSNIVSSEANIASGMRQLIEHCQGLCPSSVWSEIASLDFAVDSDRLKQWLHSLLEAQKPEENIVAFWFGLFDEADNNQEAFARLYLAGSESYDPDPTNSEWACSPAYFPEGRYADSAVLRSMSRMLSTVESDVSWLGSYVLALGYASLAMREACRHLPQDILLGRRTPRAVAVGFDSGDFITLPPINRKKLPA